VPCWTARVKRIGGHDDQEAAGQDNAPAPAAQPAYTVVKREKDRWWEMRDPPGELVCVTAYKRDVVEVMRRLAA
jgi:hypothetical protein